jgi:hypothetical protein
MNIDELKSERSEASTRRVEDTFKTESKAASLMNPHIINILID